MSLATSLMILASAWPLSRRSAISANRSPTAKHPGIRRASTCTHNTQQTQCFHRLLDSASQLRRRQRARTSMIIETCAHKHEQTKNTNLRCGETSIDVATGFAIRNYGVGCVVIRPSAGLQPQSLHFYLTRDEGHIFSTRWAAMPALSAIVL